MSWLIPCEIGRGGVIGLPRSLRKKPVQLIQRLLCSTAGFQEARRRAICDKQQIGFLIDGDQFGPGCWAAARNALNSRGFVVCSHVFGVPQNASNRQWIASLAKLNMDFIPVARTVGGAKDPNDMAIAMEASKLAACGQVDIVALMVSDLDFVYVARRLRAWNRKVLLVLRDGAKMGLAKAFQDEQAEVVRFVGDEEDGGSARQPKLQVILHDNGESSVEPFAMESYPSREHSLVQRKMKELDYLDDLDDPLVPAIAKFYYTNGLGSITVYPPKCLGEARRLFEEEPHRKWQSSSWNTMYVFPRVNALASKSALERYGTRACSSHVYAGGPFIMEAAEGVVRRILQRLQYVDNEFNNDMNEAIDVFCSVGKNQESLASLGFANVRRFNLHTKIALLHCAFASPKLHGHWYVAPGERAIRELFASKNLRLIKNRDVPRQEVMCALQRYANSLSLPPKRTYNGLILEALQHQHSHTPSRRC